MKNKLFTIVLSISLLIPKTSIGSQSTSWLDWLRQGWRGSTKNLYSYLPELNIREWASSFVNSLSTEKKYALYTALVSALGLTSYIALRSLKNSSQNNNNKFIENILSRINLSSYQQACADICKLYNNDNKMKSFIENNNNCLTLIKHLAENQKCSDEEIAIELSHCSPQAKNILYTQQHFAKLFQKDTFNSPDGEITVELVNIPLKNVNMNFTYKNNLMSALMLTTLGKHKSWVYVDFLRNGNININQQDLLGKTALMHACNKVNLTAVEEICKKDGNLNLQDNNGNTALMILAISKDAGNKAKIAEVLIALGADPRISNKQQKSPLDLDSENADLVSTIKNAMADRLERHGW